MIEQLAENPEGHDFDRIKERRLSEDVEPGTAEARALQSVAWDDVRAYLY